MQAKYTEESTAINMFQYGPIQVRPYQKQVPTIATGRRSKNLVLDGEEAIKREKKRQRNREAARKIKEKRQSIEVELDSKLQELQLEHSNLQSYLHQLQRTKQGLQREVDNLVIIPLDELLRTDSENSFSSTSDFLSDINLCDETIQKILNFDSFDTSDLSQYI